MRKKNFLCLNPLSLLAAKTNLFLLLGINQAVVEVVLLTLEDVAIKTAGLSGAGGDAGSKVPRPVRGGLAAALRGGVVARRPRHHQFPAWGEAPARLALQLVVLTI